ncbi:MAG TPA: hypothetical protein DHV59_10420 [Oxalobacteraceae bacterium]|nr:hypothetical protein [Oxalobacteraceae bacterium]
MERFYLASDLAIGSSDVDKAQEIRSRTGIFFAVNFLLSKGYELDFAIELLVSTTTLTGSNSS